MNRFLTTFGIAIAFALVAWLVAKTISGIGSAYFGDWQLVFLELQSKGHLIGIGLACMVAVACIALLFQYEQQLISWQLGTGLLLLRLCLILVLFLTLLKPVWTWSFEDEKRGRILVAVDASESMDTLDRHARDVEKLRWARAIGMVGQGDDAERIERYLKALEADEEPVWVTPDEIADPIRRDRIAKVRKQNLQDQLEAVNELSRLQLSVRALTGGNQPIVTDLEKLADTELSSFAEDFSSLQQEDLKVLPQKHDFLDRDRSDLSQPLEAALAGNSETELASIILVSDGRDTSNAEEQQLLGRLSGFGVPVHTVLVGSDYRPRDLSISHVEHPETLFEEDQALVTAQLMTSGFEDEEVKVYLDWVDEPNKAPLEKTVIPQGQTSEVTFALEDLDLGRHRFKVRMDVAENEIRDDNNEREFAMSVVDDRAQVLFLEGEGRWEFRFLDIALRRDPRVNMEHVLFTQPYLGVLPKPFFPNDLDDLNLEDDESATPFAKFDMVIVGDVSPLDLSLARWKALEKYVREEGGTLVLVAGKRHMPNSYRGKSMEALLPISNIRTLDLAGANETGPPQQRGFKLSLTPDSKALPMFQMDADPAKSDQIWAQLPGHSWGVVGEAKGGASVWAAALQPGDQAGLENERKNGLIVQRYAGTGQVIWMGIDSTWRWRYRRGDEYHHRFWGQFARWAVGFKAMSTSKDVSFGLRAGVVGQDEEVNIRARWDEGFLTQRPGLRAFGVFQSLDGTEGPVRRVELKQQQGNQLVFEATTSGLQPGEYRVTLDVPGHDWEGPAPETTLIVNPTQSPELQDVTANRALLEQIATATGGRFLQLDELGQLKDLFQDVSSVTSIREEIPLWGHWIILALFCFVATTEWVIRKLNGLP